MANKTNFAALTTNEKLVWSRELWQAARNASFAMQFMGTGSNSMIQRITELTKTEKGTQAVITLVTDLTGDGIGGDATLEDNEEEIKAYDTKILIDQLRNANRTTGRFADQRSIINFRTTSKDVLAYWLADRIDQLAFLSLAGIDYQYSNNGGDRSTDSGSYTLEGLEFQSTLPTSRRQYAWLGKANGGLSQTDATNVAVVNPSWNMLVEAKALAKDEHIRGVRGPGNTEYYHVFMTPQGLAKLKQDPEFKDNLEHAGPRGSDNPLFSGSVMTQDGLIIHEFRHVPNNSGAAATKWGTGTDKTGQAALLCGAQALGFADIGLPYWDEDEYDYNNQKGIAIGKMFGFLKPVFHSNLSGDNQDFGVIRINTATDLSVGYGDS